VQHASIEIDERCDRAGFNDRFGNIAPGEILDCADRSPARENEKLNRIAELTLAELCTQKSGNAPTPEALSRESVSGRRRLATGLRVRAIREGSSGAYDDAGL
jgi:hypothetical protein